MNRDPCGMNAQFNPALPFQMKWKGLFGKGSDLDRLDRNAGCRINTGIPMNRKSPGFDPGGAAGFRDSQVKVSDIISRRQGKGTAKGQKSRIILARRLPLFQQSLFRVIQNFTHLTQHQSWNHLMLLQCLKQGRCLIRRGTALQQEKRELLSEQAEFAAFKRCDDAGKVGCLQFMHICDNPFGRLLLRIEIMENHDVRSHGKVGREALVAQQEAVLGCFFCEAKQRKDHGVDTRIDPIGFGASQKISPLGMG